MQKSGGQRLVAGLTLAVFLLGLGGCVISVRDGDPHSGWISNDDDDDWERRQKRNAEAISYMELGRSRDSVMAELGAPDLSESFVRDGREFVVLYYRTQRVHNDGKLTRDETTPLVFVDNLLVGWGESAVANAMP